MALVTMVGTWGSHGYSDWRLLARGDLVEVTPERASSSIVVGLVSPSQKEGSELVGETGGCSIFVGEGKLGVKDPGVLAAEMEVDFSGSWLRTLVNG